MVAMTYRMLAGFPGTINRTEHATVEPQFYDLALPIIAYGLPVKIGSNGKMQPIITGDAATAIYGFLCRPFPGPASNDGLGVSTPIPISAQSNGVCSILRRGYIMVALGGVAAATKGGIVYVRVSNASAGKVIGDVEAASDTTNTIIVPNTIFTGAADANAVTEIAYNI